MAKFVFWCYRQPITDKNNLDEKTKKIAESIVPKNIKAASKYEIIRNEHTFLAIFNNNGHFEQKNQSICIGKLFGEKRNWWKIGTEKPDGNYVLVRNEEEKKQIEILNDILGTRAAWFVQTADFFMLSSSQRAIVMCLKSFERNDEAIAFMLSSGCLGPYLSWDKRIKLLPPDSKLFLDIKSWKLNVATEKCVFLNEKKSKQQHISDLQKKIEQTYNEIDIDAKKWQLLISGGYDSRANLLFFKKNNKQFSCATWGLRQEKNVIDDTFVSKKLAEHFSLSLKIIELENQQLDIKQAIQNYITNSELRTDHIAAFLHNFDIWTTLFLQKTNGVIRGDHGFGLLAVYTAFDSQRTTNLIRLNNFFTKEELEHFGLPKQKIAEKWKQRPAESLAQWRDRLYHTYLMPIVFAALTDTISMYVEVLNPLASRKIIEQVRTMPDDLRTYKKAFRQIVNQQSPKIPYANKNVAAWSSLEKIAQEEAVQKLVKQKLQSDIATNIFDENWIIFLLENMKQKKEKVKKASFKQQIFSKIAQNLPQYIKSMLRQRWLKPKISANLFAFRTYLVLEMCEILEKEAQKF